MNPTEIEHQEKIGIGTYPVFGVEGMLGDIRTLSADWFYTWMPNLQPGSVYGWSAGRGVDLTGSVDDTALLLSGQDQWVYQDVGLSGGQPWSFAFEGQVLSGSAGILLQFRDGQGSVLNTEWVGVGTEEQRYLLSGSTDDGVASVRILAYADDGSSAQFDNFEFNSNGRDIVVNGDFETGDDAQTPPGFVPMIWGAADMTELAGLAAANPGGPLLTFNEPDHMQQSRMSIEKALSLWPELMASGMRLSSPAVTTASTLRSGGWLDKFMSGAADLGYKVDFMAVHYYTTNPNVQAFKTFLDEVYAKYGKPIWVTEWSLADWSNQGRFSADEQKAFFEAATHMLDDLPYVERHAWFSAYPSLDNLQLNTELFDNPGSMNALGSAYQLLAQDPPETERLVQVIEGWPGETRYLGSDGIDTVDFSAQSTAISARLGSLSYVSIENLIGGSGNDRFWGDSHSNELIGGLGNDRLYGGDGDDILIGGEGKDILDGGLGQDTMRGGAGDDTYVVDDPGDVVDETDQWGADAGGIDTVNSSISFSLASVAGLVEKLRLTGSSDIDGAGNDLNNVLTGNSGANVLEGGAGNDTLKGGGGNDTLIGGFGNDRLYGGQGSDTFVFTEPFGRDVIVDFGSDGTDNDMIHLSLGEAFDTFEEVFAASKQVGANTLISLGGNGTIMLGNFSLDMLSPDHFTFG